MPSKSPTFSDSSWEILATIEEGHDHGSNPRERTSHTLRRQDKHLQSRLRTDHVLRRRIIVGACVGSFLFLAVLGFGVGLFAA